MADAIRPAPELLFAQAHLDDVNRQFVNAEADMRLFAMAATFSQARST